MAKAFSEDLKWRIIYLWIEGFSLWNNVNDLKEQEPGRKKIFDNSDMKVLIQLIKEVPDLYLDEIAAKMALRTGKSVSIATIWRKDFVILFFPKYFQI
ncbi:unnamed protein product [Rhizophagus irregularis]|nr:unnamed protein product [Rhizophagus irregularis]